MIVPKSKPKLRFLNCSLKTKLSLDRRQHLSLSVPSMPSANEKKKTGTKMNGKNEDENKNELHPMTAE